MKITEAQRVFCSFAYTGEDAATVERRMGLIVKAFGNLGIQAYCNLYDERVQGFTAANQYILAARAEIRQCDVLFAVVASERRSEGQLIEIGVALEREMPIVVGLHESAVGTSYLDEVAGSTFTWSDDEALVRGIDSLV